MPSESRAQNRFWHGHEHDESPLGDTAREFLKADEDRSIRDLPLRVKTLRDGTVVEMRDERTLPPGQRGLAHPATNPAYTGD